ARLNLAPVAGPSEIEHLIGAAPGRDRVVRIVAEPVGGLFAGGRLEAEDAVLTAALAAAEIERGPARGRQRPVCLLAPLVLAHDEDLDRLLGVDARLHPLEAG